MSVEVSGSCLCKKTHINATLRNTDVSACHCSMCRTWGGGPFLTAQCEGPVTVTGPVTAHDSSEWAQRGFCSQCGTHLFYRLKQSELYVVPVGLFDANAGWNFTEQIFIDEKPTWYCFKNQTKDLTGQQVFDQFSQP